MSTWEQVADEAIRFHGAAQNAGELVPLLEAVAAAKPRRVVEIGSWNGGSLYAWAQLPGPPRVLSVDLVQQPQGGWHGAGHIEGDSHRPETFAQVCEWLAGDLIDFLWIDGDHTWHGAMADFFMYGGLVRPGGLLGLHDIAQDIGPAAAWGSVMLAGDIWQPVGSWVARAKTQGTGLLRRV